MLLGCSSTPWRTSTPKDALATRSSELHRSRTVWVWNRPHNLDFVG